MSRNKSAGLPRHAVDASHAGAATKAAHARGTAPASEVVAPAPVSNQALGQMLRGGRPLERSVRTEMESRFRADFSTVRIHDEPSAHDIAQQQQAQAFAVGDHVAFNTGRYAPGRPDGKHLLAHELAHVVQQRRGGTELPRAGSALEQAAEHAASAAVAGVGPVQVAGASAVGVARQPLPQDEPADLPPAPQSLSGSLAKDEKHLKEPALEYEMALIEGYLDALPAIPEREHLLSEYKALFRERVARRNKAPAQRPWRKPDDVKREVQEAHRHWRLTGQIPQTRWPFSWAEIKVGKPMTRSERYDFMLKLQNRSEPVTVGDLVDDKVYPGEGARDPEFLSHQEFHDEFYERFRKAAAACSAGLTRPDVRDRCLNEVKGKWGGPGFRAAREQAYQRTYALWVHAQAQIEAMKSGGLASLGGRVAGYALGKATGNDPLRWSEHGAALGGMAGMAGAGYVGYTQRTPLQNYHAGGGLQVGRDADTHVMTPRWYGPSSTGPDAPPLFTPGGSSRNAGQPPFSAAGATSLPAPIPISSGQELPQSQASKVLAANLARQSPAQVGSITPLPVKKPKPPPPTEAAQQALPAVAAVQEKIAVGQTHGAGGTVATGAKPTASAAGTGAKPAVASLKQPAMSSKPAVTGSMKPGIASKPKSASAVRAVPLKAPGRRGTAAERLAALDVPADQRAGFAAASARIDELAKKDPPAAERLLQALEQRFAVKDRASQVNEQFQQAQEQTAPDKGARNVHRQSTAADDRQRVDQNDPNPKTVLKAKVRDSERLGVAGGREQATREKIAVRDWDPPQQYKGEFGVGPDDLGARGDKRLFLEYKGGSSPLGRSNGVVEMSNVWAGRKIAEIEMVGDKATAADLLAAARKGNLQGVVYRTRGTTGAETTVRLRASQLRDALRDESITEAGVIEYAPSKVLQAYQARKAQLQDAIDRGDLKALKNL